MVNWHNLCMNECKKNECKTKNRKLKILRLTPKNPRLMKKNYILYIEGYTYLSHETELMDVVHSSYRNW